VDWPDLFFGLLSTGRGEAGGASPHANLIADDQLKLPIVLRLVRLGTVLRAEYSLDEGKTFRLGSRIFLGASPAKRLHAGLAVSSGDRSQIGEARFSGLEIKPR
jgi:hypothetical protein